MGVEAPLKDCPSCGSQIPEAATLCSICKSSLGRCTGCDHWLVVGIECFDCGGSTAIRIRKAAVAAGGPPPASVEIDASPVALLPLLALRAVFFAGFAAAVVTGLADSGLPQITRVTGEYVTPPKPGTGPYAWAAAGGCALLIGAAGTLVRRYRLNHTRILGKPVESRSSLGSMVLNLFITVLVLGLTAGLGFPWLYARYRRSFYRGCRLTARGTATLDFQGSGEDVLGRFFLTLLLLPFAVATCGLLLGVISWMWVKWDQSNLLVPDKHGQNRSPKFAGTFGAYYGRWLLGWVLTIVTAGIYRGWAKVSEWRWMASQTVVA